MLAINCLHEISWHIFSKIQCATNVPLTFGVFLKILAIPINKKILQIIDFAGFNHFLVLFKNFKSCTWRRVRDSNPRTCYSQQFSRLPQSTTLPTLPKLRLYRCFQWCKYRTIFNFCKTFPTQILTKLNNRLGIRGIIFHEILFMFSKSLNCLVHPISYKYPS